MYVEEWINKGWMNSQWNSGDREKKRRKTEEGETKLNLTKGNENRIESEIKVDGRTCVEERRNKGWMDYGGTEDIEKCREENMRNQSNQRKGLIGNY